MIRMAMGDQRPIDGFPRINVKIPRWAVDPAICKGQHIRHKTMIGQTYSIASEKAQASCRSWSKKSVLEAPLFASPAAVLRDHAEYDAHPKGGP